jgi:dTDP-4-amino-4,6-dideoxygalactose transaminase
MRVEFSPPDITEEEIEAVAAVLRSGWITTGERVAELEAALTAYTGAAGTVCLSSGTAALEMALRLLGIGPGDEVITTAYTYSATAAAICHVGARPVLCDLPAEGYLLTAEMIEPLLTTRTRAVIPVDFAGICCDYRAIKTLLWQKYRMFTPQNPVQEAIGRVAIIADAAHSLGACRDGVMSGALADFTCLSFHAVKNLTTAEGGAICWRNIAGADHSWIERQIRLLSLHGQTRTAREKLAGGWEYDIVMPGYKCNMTDCAAALGLVQLRRYPELLARRRAICRQYDTLLDGLSLELPGHILSGQNASACHLYPVYLPGCTEVRRGVLMEALSGSGVMANVHYKPLPMLTAYRALGYSPDSFPNAYRRYAGELTLPLHSRMNEAEVAYTVMQFTDIATQMGLLPPRHRPRPGPPSFLEGEEDDD